MRLQVVAGTAGTALAAALAGRLGGGAVPVSVDRFPDGELRPQVGELRGADVYVVQPTSPPVNEALVELLLLLDACRRSGAERITALLPYFGYARQDRRERPGEPVGARAVADVLTAAGAQRVVVVDPHSPALESAFAIPVERVTAFPVLAAAVAETLEPTAVVLAPDLGAVGLAERFGVRLDRPVAVVRKTRISGTAVRATQLVGEVSGRPLVIVDDMISTGATIEAAVRVALDHGAVPDVTVAASHALLVGGAVERLESLPVRRVVVTDTVPSAVERPWLDRRSIAARLADTIAVLHTSSVGALPGSGAGALSDSGAVEPLPMPG